MSGDGQYTNSPSSSYSDRKKKSESANHLLQFKLPPRQRPPSYNYSHGRKAKSSYQPYDKKRFVHANYRFIISDKYSHQHLHVIDPDAIVPWEYIEQVIVTSGSEHNCPICLSTPIAPQIAPCGHVFCSSCILHYLSLGDKSWRSCPICHDYLHAKELKSAMILNICDYSRFKDDSNSAQPSAEELFLQEAYNEVPEKPKDYIIMRLMQRSTGSSTVLPRNQFTKWALSDLPKLDGLNRHLLSFSKIMIASPQYIVEHIIGSELVALDQAAEDAKSLGDTDEIAYIEMAMQKCKERLEMKRSDVRKSRTSSFSLGNTDYSISNIVDATHISKLTMESSSSIKKNLSNDEIFLPPPEIAPDPFSDISAATAAVEEDIIMTSLNESSAESSLSSREISPKLSPTTNPMISTKRKSTSTDGMLYFYQALDGQHIYLHPLEIKILKSEYGDYANFPDEICVKISTLAESTLTEDARKRYKYVSHLPLNCDVSFLEIDWNDGKNVCRKLVPKSEAIPLGTSPSFYSTGNSETEKYELDKLVHNSSIKQWSNELNSRKQKRVKKKKKEDKEDARRRRDSMSKSNDDEVSAIPRRTPPTVNINEDIFDFDDESKWVPLGAGGSSTSKMSPTTSKNTHPPSPRLTPTETTSNSSVIMNSQISKSLPSYAAKAQGVISTSPEMSAEPQIRKKGKKKQVVLFSNSGSRRS